MAYLPRSILVPNNATFHVTWQCHNHDFFLKHDWAKQKYYELLLAHKSKYNIKIHSYCFMSNHPHMTGFSPSQKNLSGFFKTVNSLIARHINKVLQRRGQLVMDRFKSPIIQDHLAHLDVMHYNDLNPKRANMVEHPETYKWSSYQHYAHGKTDPLIDDPDCYTRLGSTPKERQQKYREMLETILENDWKEKKDYSVSAYIGNPEWVAKRYEAVLNIYRGFRKETQEKARTILSPPP